MQDPIGHRIPSLLRTWLPTIVVALLGIGLSAYFATLAHHQQERLFRAGFEEAAHAQAAMVQKRIERSMEVVESVACLFAAGGEVGRDAFRAFVASPLSYHPDIQALEWIPRVAGRERAHYEDAARADGLGAFRFTERKPPDRMIAAGARDEYYPVYYIEPMAGNEAALGYDLGSDRVRLSALEQARDSGSIVATPRISLVQEQGRMFGMLMLRPVYAGGDVPETIDGRRERLRGFALGVFRIGDVVEEALKGVPPSGLDIYLHDAAATQSERLLYFHPSRTRVDSVQQPVALSEPVQVRVPLELPGRQWQMVFSPAPAFGADYDPWSGWQVLALGLLFTGLVVGSMATTMRGNARIAALVQRLGRANDGLRNEVAERQRAELALRDNNAALAESTGKLIRSNQNLQEFAYVVSHDLQEPLRMVSSYLQLISRRYQGQLDKDADEFIEFAVDGANRMAEMINGLLQYSRVETQGEPFANVDMETLFAEAMDNLRLGIEDSGAEVSHGPLPTVVADRHQMARLIQNLLGNAIKYHGDTPPHVHVLAEETDEGWHFSVRDNGIGIAQKDAERIFTIFQRLHTQSEIPGTGIGLAVCKRIVERHGGRLWVESQPGEGSTFHFTLPYREAVK